MPIVAAVIIAGGAIAASKMGQAKAPGQAATVNIQDEQRRAIDGNLANGSKIEQLVNTSNIFSQNQANSLAEQAMPGYTKLAQSLTNQAQTMTNDPYGLPADVQDNLTRIAGERGINTGVRGQAGDFSALRDLGVNELQYGQSRISQAQSILSSVSASAPRINPMSATSMYLTPSQALQTATNNQSADQAALNARTATDNYNAALNAQAVSTSANAFAGAVGGMGGAATATKTPAYTGMGSTINQPTYASTTSYLKPVDYSKVP